MGLSWANWMPYWERTWSLVDQPAWPSGAIFDSAGDAGAVAVGGVVAGVVLAVLV